MDSVKEYCVFAVNYVWKLSMSHEQLHDRCGWSREPATAALLEELQEMKPTTARLQATWQLHRGTRISQDASLKIKRGFWLSVSLKD
jgi:hypothetical protein